MIHDNATGNKDAIKLLLWLLAVTALSATTNILPQLLEWAP